MTRRAPSSTSSSRPPEYLVVGHAGRAVGLRGEVEVLIVSDAPERFAPGSVVLAGPDRRCLTVRRLRHHRGRAVVIFEEVADRTQAEALRGAELCIPTGQARALEDGEYWDHELVGCEVLTTSGEGVGVVTDVLHAGANEILVVAAEGAEHLVPLVRGVVVSVEPGSRITIDPPPGLLDEGPLPSEG